MIGTSGVLWAGISTVHTLSWAFDRPADSILLIMLLTAGMIGSTIEIRFGQEGVTLNMAGVPFLLAVMYLPTQQAVIVGFFAFMWQLQKSIPEHTMYWRLCNLYVCAINAISVGGITWMVGQFFGDASKIDPHLLLPVIVGAAIVNEVLFDVLLLLIIEFNSRGATREFLRSAKVTTIANVVLPTMALMIVNPFMDEPLVAMGVMTAVQVIVYFAMRVANSEQLERKRNAHLQQVFSRYVPATIVDSHVDQMQAVHLGGEQREVSVLFCDIRGFTSWSENKEAQEIVTELNVLLSELSQAVFTTAGTLDKFTGDGLMAFWGAPLLQPDHAQRAAEAALEMLVRVESVNVKRAEKGHDPFAIGVGVHSGPAVVGNIGHEERLDFTAIGDTVNLAARLEAATKEIGSVLLISHETYAMLDDEMRDRAMRIGAIKVKGRRKPVEAFALKPRRPEFDLSGDPHDLAA